MPTNTDIEKSNYKKYTDQCSEVYAFIEQANISTNNQVALADASHILNKLKHYVGSRENLSAKEQQEKYAIIEEKLKAFLSIADQESLLPQGYKD
ncbi:MAG: hypothetical protein IPN22_11470 [Bacteroidetes bacterium]|nr:hypothetical protein [Bacteroidota bacterium]